MFNIYAVFKTSDMFILRCHFASFSFFFYIDSHSSDNHDIHHTDSPAFKEIITMQALEMGFDYYQDV